MTTRTVLFALLAACVFSAGTSATAAKPRAPDQHILLAQAFQTATAESSDASDELKISALEALMAAPSARAFPLVKKVLEGQHSDAVKIRALFVLSQIRVPEAEALLLGIATNEDSPLQHEAIRMVGIGGSRESLRKLGAVYSAGNSDLRKSVLNAWLIADDAELVYAVARDASDEEEFEVAVTTLGAMQATEQLRKLYEKGGHSSGISRAYAIAGDLQSLTRIVSESTDPEQRTRAIRNIGIIDGEAAGKALMDIYRQSPDEESRSAALQGLLVNGYDQGVMTLFRESTDSDEKRRLLRTLGHMDSDLALELIDSTLDGDTQ